MAAGARQPSGCNRRSHGLRPPGRAPLSGLALGLAASAVRCWAMWAELLGRYARDRSRLSVGAVTVALTRRSICGKVPAVDGMSELDRFYLDRSVKRAWATFQARLADHVAPFPGLQSIYTTPVGAADCRPRWSHLPYGSSRSLLEANTPRGAVTGDRHGRITVTTEPRGSHVLV